MSAPVPAYVFKAQFLLANDGDSQTYRLDCGKFPTTRVNLEPQVRVLDLWCPELNELGGPAARDYALALLSGAAAAGKPIVVRTLGPSFSRTVGEVWIGDEKLSDAMIEAGHGFRTRAERATALTLPPGAPS